MKQRLVQSNAERVRRIEAGDITVVGVNAFTETAPIRRSSTRSTASANILVVDAAVEREQIDAARCSGATARDADAVARGARHRARRPRAGTDNLTPATVALARAGGTVGEWAGALREVFGEYRAPTGVGGVHAAAGEAMVRARARVQDARPTHRPSRSASSWASPGSTVTPTAPSRSRSPRATRAWRSSTRASGSRPSRSRPRRATRTSTWSACRCSRGRTARLVPEILALLRAHGVDAPVVVGGIIPEADQPELLAAGVARVYTPKDFRVSDIVAELADLVAARSSTRPNRRRPSRGRLPRRRAVRRAGAGRRRDRRHRGDRRRGRARPGGRGGRRGRRGRRRAGRRAAHPRRGLPVGSPRPGPPAAPSARRRCRRRWPRSNCWPRRGPSRRRPPARDRHRGLGDRPGVGPAARAPPSRAAPAGGGGRPAQGAAGLGRVLGARRSRGGAGATRASRHSPRSGTVAWRTLRESDAVFRLGRRRRGGGARRHRRAGCARWSPSACARRCGRARSATRSRCRPGSRATRRTRSTPPSSSLGPGARSSSARRAGHERDHVAIADAVGLSLSSEELGDLVARTSPRSRAASASSWGSAPRESGSHSWAAR